MGLMAWGSKAGSGSLFAHQIIFSATNLMSLDGFCRHCGEEHGLSVRHIQPAPRRSPGSALTLPSSWDMTPCSLRGVPTVGGRLGMFGPYLPHIISHHPLLGSALSAPVGFQLPQRPHAASCLAPLRWRAPLLGTCLQILTCRSPLILQASAQMSAFRHPRQPYLDEGPPTGPLCTSTSRDFVCPAHLRTSGSGLARRAAGPQ